MERVRVTLKYKFSDLFKGRFPIPKKLYECLESLQEDIENKSPAKPVFAKDVTIGKRALKKEFGNPKEFDNVGVVLNPEGAYLIVSDGANFQYCVLEEV